MFLGAAIVAALYATVCLGYYSFQEAILFHPESLPEEHAFALSVPFEEVYLEASDGVRLHALHARAPGGVSRGVVLHFHGNAENADDLGPRIEDFAAAGFDVVAPDYRGFGKSGGRIRGERRFIADAELWADYVAERYPDAPVVVSGYSIGTGPAVQVAAELRTDLLILEAPFTSLLDLARDKTPFLPNALLLKYPLRSERHIGEVHAPILVFHGTEDSLIPPTHGRRLATTAGPTATFVPVEGAGHNDVGASDTYERLVAEHLASLSSQR